MKFRLFLGLVAVSVAACAAAPKYVFLFIGDGMSTPQRMVAEEFSRATGTGPLAMNALPYQYHAHARGECGDYGLRGGGDGHCVRRKGEQRRARHHAGRAAP